MICLLRADAGPQMGTGHVMRCLALAQAWQDVGGQTVLAAAELPPSLRERCAAERVGVEDLKLTIGGPDDAHATASLAKRLGARWVVVDGYHFFEDYQRRLRDQGLRVLAVDDYGHCRHYWADAVLNQNLHARPSLYESREPYVRLLLGTEYALLRREFKPWRAFKRTIGEQAACVLVTLGGADPDNVTLKVIEALKRLDATRNRRTKQGQAEAQKEGERSWMAYIVVGASNPHLKELQTAVDGLPDARLLVNLREMALLMARAELCVAAGGSTNWELAFMGLPTLALILADNQESLVRELAERGVVRSLGWHHEVSVESLAAAIGLLLADAGARAALGAAGRSLVDGLGAERVVEVLAS